MALATCPTVVVLFGEAASSAGALARELSQRSLRCRPMCWAMRGDGARIEAIRTSVPGDGAGADGESQVGTPYLVASHIVGRALTVGDVESDVAMDEPVALRLSIVATLTDVEGLAPIVRALHQAAHRHVGNRHLREAFVLLTRPPADVPPVSGGQPPALPDVHVCWWIGDINSRGQVLPEPRGIDTAAIVAATLSLPADRLPLGDAATGLPIHMSAGYAELAADAPSVAAAVSDRHVARIVRDLFLTGESSVDRKAVRRGVWVMVSGRCQPELDRVAETSGGEKIWKGLRVPVPDEVAQGVTGGLIRAVNKARHAFEERGLADCRRRFEESARARAQTLVRVLDAELATAAQGEGRLFELLAVLEALAGLLPESLAADDGETAINLPEVLRKYYERLELSIGMEAAPALASIANYHLLNSEYAALALVNVLMRPPALPEDIYRELRIEDSSIERRLDAAREALAGARQLSAQETFDSVITRHRLLDEKYEQERGNRDASVTKADEHLHLTRGAWESAVLRLREFDGQSAWMRWFAGQRRDELESAVVRAHGAMLGAARAYVDANEAWAALRVEYALFQARIRAIARLLDHVEHTHRRLTETLRDLAAAEPSLRDAAPDERAGGRLRRPLVRADDLPVLSQAFTPAADTLDAVLGGSSLLAVALTSAAAILQRLRAHSTPIHASLASSGIEALMRLCKRDSLWMKDTSAWIRAVSAPWIASTCAPTVDACVASGCGDSPFGRVLQETLPAAAWIDEPYASAVMVVRMRRFASADDIASSVLHAASGDTTVQSQS